MVSLIPLFYKYIGRILTISLVEPEDFLKIFHDLWYERKTFAIFTIYIICMSSYAYVRSFNTDRYIVT